MRGRVPRCEACDNDQSQMTCDLKDALPVVTLIERVEISARHVNAKPVDFHSSAIRLLRLGGWQIATSFNDSVQRSFISYVGLAIRRGKNDRHDGRLIAVIAGVVDDIGGNHNCIPRPHWVNLVLKRVNDAPAEYMQDLFTVGMGMAEVCVPGL